MWKRFKIQLNEWQTLKKSLESRINTQRKKRTEQLKREDKEKVQTTNIRKLEFQKERKNKMEGKYKEVSPRKTDITSIQISES